MLKTLSRPVCQSHLTITLLYLPLRGPDPSDALLLVLPKPGLLRFTQNSFAKIIDKMANHDQHERDRV